MEPDHPVTRRELNEAFAAFKTEVTEVMRDIETNLLRAFHGYAQGTAARFGGLEVTDRELRVRMDALESRVLALETRRPPAA